MAFDVVRIDDVECEYQQHAKQSRYHGHTHISFTPPYQYQAAPLVAHLGSSPLESVSSWLAAEADPDKHDDRRHWHDGIGLAGVGVMEWEDEQGSPDLGEQEFSLYDLCFFPASPHLAGQLTVNLTLRTPVTTSHKRVVPPAASPICVTTGLNRVSSASSLPSSLGVKPLFTISSSPSSSLSLVAAGSSPLSRTPSVSKLNCLSENTNYVDMAQIIDQLCFMLRNFPFQDLKSVGDAICRHLLTHSTKGDDRPNITSVQLSLSLMPMTTAPATGGPTISTQTPAPSLVLAELQQLHQNKNGDDERRTLTNPSSNPPASQPTPLTTAALRHPPSSTDNPTLAAPPSPDTAKEEEKRRIDAHQDVIMLKCDLPSSQHYSTATASAVPFIVPSTMTTLTSTPTATTPTPTGQTLYVTKKLGDVHIDRELNQWGDVDIVYENSVAGLYRLNIGGLKGIPLHVHKIMHEAEMVMAHQLHSQGRAVPYGAVHRWGDASHEYYNPLPDRSQTVFCVDIPAFIPYDEIQLNQNQNQCDRVAFCFDSLPFWLRVVARQLSSPSSSPSTAAAPMPSVSSSSWAASTPVSSASSLPLTHPAFIPSTPSVLPPAPVGFRAPTLCFPGAFPGQSTLLCLDPTQFEPHPHAVLVLVFDTAASSSSSPHSSSPSHGPPSSCDPGLLLVHHRKRGWELPGGKVDHGETAIDAAVRETWEEAGVMLDPSWLRPLAQYTIIETVPAAGGEPSFGTLASAASPLNVPPPPPRLVEKRMPLSSLSLNVHGTQSAAPAGKPMMTTGGTPSPAGHGRPTPGLGANLGPGPGSGLPLGPTAFVGGVGGGGHSVLVHHQPSSNGINTRDRIEQMKRKHYSRMSLEQHRIDLSSSCSSSSSSSASAFCGSTVFPPPLPTGAKAHVKTVFLAQLPQPLAVSFSSSVSSCATSAAEAAAMTTAVAAVTITGAATTNPTTVTRPRVASSSGLVLNDTDRTRSRFVPPPTSYDVLQQQQQTSPNSGSGREQPTVKYSTLLQDNVYPICLQLARAVLHLSEWQPRQQHPPAGIGSTTTSTIVPGVSPCTSSSS